LTGRLFSVLDTRPALVAVHTLEQGTKRLPRVDTHFYGPKLQPYIHDTIVSIVHCGKVHRFFVFMKNHVYLPRNKGVTSIRGLRTRVWKGDILVMRAGQKMTLVNLRAGDGPLVTLAVER
ncbi:hypothetical protein C8J56DRAFT_801967, partial [Mycena floridula]